MTDNDAPLGGYRIYVGSAEEATILRIEPVDQFEIPAGEEFTIHITGPSDETVELTHSRGFVEVWPSPKLSVRLLDGNGEQLRLFGY